MKDNYLVQAWLVLTLSLAFGAALAGVQISLQPQIDANKIAETMSKIPAMVPGATAKQSRSEKIAIVKQGREKVYQVYRACDAQNQHVGWVISTSGQGFADAIELLIGVDAQARSITGLFVLSQKETPGLGNKIEAEAWRAQYVGKRTSPALEVRKGGVAGAHEIAAIAGATVSSKAVTDTVNTTLSDLQGELAKRALSKE